LEIIYKSPSELKPFQKNPYNHPEKQLTMLKKSMREFGFTSPVLISQDNMVIAGHARLKAAQEIGLSEVPTIFIDLPYEKAVAYVIADNQLAKLAEEDRDLLGELLQGINDIPDFDIEAVGFSSEDIDTLLKSGEPVEVVEDDFNPDGEIETRCKEGDLWELGRHRLLCGDSTKREDVERLINGKMIDLCLTDPPYGIGNTDSDKNNYNLYEDSKENLLKTINGFLPLAQLISKCVVFTPGNGNVHYYPPPTWMMAWFTPAGVGRGPWGFCCWQPILCYGKDPKLSKRLGCHPDAIVHTESAEKFGHPCTKPINFWGWLMDRTSEINELIYDPFCGSGTTLIACEQLNRTCYGMELDPHYCDVIISRWEQFTGQTAKKLT
jgi:hypothetical protein